MNVPRRWPVPVTPNRPRPCGDAPRELILWLLSAAEELALSELAETSSDDPDTVWLVDVTDCTRGLLLSGPGHVLDTNHPDSR